MEDKIDLIVEENPKDFDIAQLKYPKDKYDLVSVDRVERYKSVYYKKKRNCLQEYFVNHTQVVVTLRCKRCGTIKQVIDSSKLSCNQGPCNTNWKDMSGQQSGKLTVLSYEFVPYRKGEAPNWYWKCHCACGKDCYKTSHALLNSGTIECPSCAIKTRSCSLMKEDGGAAWNSAYKTTKDNAQKRHYEFSLTMDQFKELSLQPCYYCGAEPHTPLGIGRNKHLVIGYRNGLDRIDNTKGYTVDNCVPCCYTCNAMKTDHKYADWLAHMEQILKYCKERSTTIPNGSTPKQVETDSGDKTA